MTVKKAVNRHSAGGVSEKSLSNLTGGSRKGVPNKATAAIKDMITQALDGVGGVEYLKHQADKNPVAFMGLVAKVIPLQVNGAGENGEHIISVVRWID